MSAIDFTVSFKGKTIPLTGWSTAATIEQVKSRLKDETSISNDCQKLLWKGKLLHNDQATLESIGVHSQDKIMLIGSQREQVVSVQKLDEGIAKLQANQRVLKTVKPQQRQPRSVKDIKYTFHDISVLPEFNEQDKARRLLERLRDDRGVQAIMAKYKWSVAKLVELSPFETSILGYNRNAGQLIAIRLRTDDLTGFRHYDSVRKVLLHELTHNVWGDHDDNFHKMNRQLNKDVVALDWSAHGGHQLQSDGHYYQLAENDDDINQGATVVTWEAGSYRLGGGQDIISSSSVISKREQAAKAALSRLTQQEEQEMDEGCGNS